MKVVQFCKSQPVLIIAFLAATATMFFVPPDTGYIGYCNRTVLIQLFSLMAAVVGFRSIGIFERLTGFLLKKASDIRKLGMAFMLFNFFSAMFVTNDVALLVFVPLTILALKDIDDERSKILIIVLETVAANMGSMLTPIGNPQNLYLYDTYNLTLDVFIKTMLPLGIISLICLMSLTLLLPKTECIGTKTELEAIPYKHMTAYIVLFLTCLLTVFRIVPDILCLVIAVLIAIIFDYILLTKVDYALLATFVCFFVFVGNIARIEMVQEFFSIILVGRELLVSTLLSQAISNVPAAVMLSGFTENGTALLIGVNIGGLGTIIASLASLISFQFYRKSDNAKVGRYMLYFTSINVVMLIVMLGVIQLK